MAEFGIHPYYTAPSASADLVLVHGLMGSSTGTWTGQDKAGKSTFWPDWIKAQCPSVNIWLVDYDSSLNAWIQPAMPLDSIAGAVLSHAKDQGLGQRPIHWVGHSMGGLVIKHLLRQAREKANPDWQRMSDATAAITFLGTPHHGSAVANWESYFSALLGAADVLAGTGGVATGLFPTVLRLLTGGGSSRSSHVDQLRAHSRELGSLNDSFAQWLGSADRRGSLRAVRSYYEELPAYKSVYVVPKHSAQLANALVEEAGVQANHFDICKFASDRLPVYLGLLRATQVASEGFPNESIVVAEGLRDSHDPRRVQSGAIPMSRSSEEDETRFQASSWHEAAGTSSSLPPVDEVDTASSSVASAVPDLQVSDLGMGEGVVGNRMEQAQRVTFICYAAKDPDWPQHEVEDLANEILSNGVEVRLDTWRVRDEGRNFSLAEWRDWMAACQREAANIVYLTSPHYMKHWMRDPAVSGGLGVAFESMRMVHRLYLDKQRNDGRMLTVRKVHHTHDDIPEDLVLDCPSYVLPEEAKLLMSHLRSRRNAAGVPPQPEVLRAVDDESPTDAVRDDSDGRRHQSEHASLSLTRVPKLWTAIQKSSNLKAQVADVALADPCSFVKAIRSLDATGLQSVMRELRRVFAQERPALADASALTEAASATVALYLMCACQVIEAEGGRLIVGLPQVSSRDASSLLASLIGMVMAGGRLDLRSGAGELPKGSGTVLVKLVSDEAESNFERELFSLLVKKPWGPAAGLKVGPLIGDERSQLLVALEDLRGEGDDLRAVSLVVECPTAPALDQFKLARELKLPVFHAHEKVAHRLLGMDEAKLVTLLQKLWEDVGCALAADEQEE